MKNNEYSKLHLYHKVVMHVSKIQNTLMIYVRTHMESFYEYLSTYNSTFCEILYISLFPTWKNQSSIGAKIDWTNPSVISGLPISFSFKAKNITVILCQNWFVSCLVKKEWHRKWKSRITQRCSEFVMMP